jgi:hypothetical protein
LKDDVRVDMEAVKIVQNVRKEAKAKEYEDGL